MSKVGILEVMQGWKQPPRKRRKRERKEGIRREEEKKEIVELGIDGEMGFSLGEKLWSDECDFTKSS